MSSKQNPEGHYCVALFPSTSAALRAEKLLQSEGITIKLIPVPRQLSSDCGICVRFERLDQTKVEAILGQSSLQVQGICLI